jgi:hypothetical protein
VDDDCDAAGTVEEDSAESGVFLPFVETAAEAVAALLAQFPFPPTTVTSPRQCSRNWSSQLATVDKGQMMSVARLRALIRHSRTYSASSFSWSLSAFLALLSFVADDEGAGGSGMPHTAPAKCEALGCCGFLGGGCGCSNGCAAKLFADCSVAAIRDTQVIVFPKPICVINQNIASV